MSLANFRKVNGGKCTDRYHVGPSDGSTCQCKSEEQHIDVIITPEPIITNPPKVNEDDQ